MIEIKLNKFTIIPNFTSEVLRLKGIDKEIYSIIYGFSQDEDSTFRGSIKYLCNITLYSKNTVLDSLKKLVDSQLIIKYVKNINGVQFCEYSYNKETLKNKYYEYEKTNKINKLEDCTTGAEIAPPIPKTEPNNIVYNIDNINIKEKINKKENKTEKEVFDEFRKLYKGTKRGLDTEFDNFKKKHKDYKQVLPILKESYLKQEEIRDIKTAKGEFVPQYANLQTWINQRRWEIEEELFDVVGDKITNERFMAYLRATKDFPMTYIRQLSESEFNDLIKRYPADLIYNKVVEIVNKPNGAKWLYEEIKTRIRNGQ